jgi:hypothetical protein
VKTLKNEMSHPKASTYQACAELARPCHKGAGGIHEELVPGWDILLEFAEAHKTAIGHPVWVLACVRASVAKDYALLDSILSMPLGLAVVPTAYDFIPSVNFLSEGLPMSLAKTVAI